MSKPWATMGSWCAAFMMCGTVAGWAQEAPASGQRSILRVSGESKIDAKPEQARIEVGVVTEAETADQAASENADKLTEVLDRLRETVGSETQVETASYSLSPKYHYPRDGTEPSITGYTATNVVALRSLALEDVGKAIDAATQTGANRIQRLEFELADEEAVKRRALREAAEVARGRAEALASALDLRIVRIVSVEQGEPSIVRPYRAPAMARAEAMSAPTPVEPGAVEIHATVVLTVEVEPATP